jgi:hypothetical protein
MRACFLGQNICALGFGVATLRAPPLVMDQPAPETPLTPEFLPEFPEESLTASTVDQHASPRGLDVPVLRPIPGTQPVTNSPRLMA